MKLGEALAWARARIDVVDARVLLEHVSGFDRAAQIAREGQLLEPSVQAAFSALVERRAAGEPVAYLTGQREFHGRDFRVSAATLIPRPETEHLIDSARESIREIAAPRILDLGTGSGIIAITLALEIADAQVVAVDASREALAVAQDNARRLGAKVEFYQGDWFAALPAQAPGRRFNLIVSNPPYIAAGDLHLAEGDLRFEPAGALTDGSENGLASLRRIIAGAPAHLVPGGFVWVEHGYDQAAACRALLVAGGFRAVTSHRDLAGIERVSGGRLG